MLPRQCNKATFSSLLCAQMLDFFNYWMSFVGVGVGVVVGDLCAVCVTVVGVVFIVGIIDIIVNVGVVDIVNVVEGSHLIL